jgi:hypothetical protein
LRGAAPAGVVVAVVLTAAVRVGRLYVLVVRDVLLLLGAVELERGCEIWKRKRKIRKH